MGLPSGPIPSFPRTTGLQDGNKLNALAQLIGSYQPGVTAHAGGGKASAYQLNASVVEIEVSATAADSVKLPPGYPGLEVIIFNNGAQSAQVFGSGLDTINGVATGTGVAQAAGKSALYKCYEVAAGVGKWLRIFSA